MNTCKDCGKNWKWEHKCKNSILKESGQEKNFQRIKSFREIKSGDLIYEIYFDGCITCYVVTAIGQQFFLAKEVARKSKNTKEFSMDNPCAMEKLCSLKVIKKSYSNHFVGPWYLKIDKKEIPKTPTPSGGAIIKSEVG